MMRGPLGLGLGRRFAHTGLWLEMMIAGGVFGGKITPLSVPQVCLARIADIASKLVLTNVTVFTYRRISLSRSNNQLCSRHALCAESVDCKRQKGLMFVS